MWRIIPTADEFTCGSLQVVSIFEVNDSGCRASILSDVQLKVRNQDYDTAHITFVDVNFLKMYIRTEYVRSFMDGIL